MRKPPFLMVIALLFSLSVQAQNVITMATQVIPPYSPYLSDYTSYDNRLVLLLSNNVTNATQEVRLVGEMVGNNGVILSIPISYIPPKPITIFPRQTLRLTGNQLREYFNENAFQLTGVTQEELTLGNGLPEGNYELCLRAVDYNTGRFLSMPEPMGCAYFTITHLEPPFIVQPACGEIMPQTKPQNLFFSWSVPAGANPGDIEYVLKVAEMYPPDIDPNQAMLASVEPPLFEKVVYTNTYLYGLADPVLEQGKKYAFRVTAQPKGGFNVRIPGKNIPNFRNNGHSEVCSFTYGSPLVVDVVDPIEDQKFDKPVEDQQPIEDVIVKKAPDGRPAVNPVNPGVNYAADDPQPIYFAAECSNPVNFANVTAVNTFGANDIVNIGDFQLRLSSDIGPGNYNGSNQLSGEGVIINLHFKIPLRVEFLNISINSDGEVFEGEVFGKDEANMPIQWARDFINDFTAVEADGNLPDVAQKLQDEYQERVSAYPWQEYYAVGLPVGIQRQVAGADQTIAIVGAQFTPAGAALNALCQINIPQYEQTIALGAKNFCITPSGLTNQGTLHLLKNVNINEEGNISFRLDASNEADLGTYAVWDTEGFETMQIEGAIVFSESIMQPVGGGGPVEAAFTVLTEGGFSDWKIDNITLEPFELTALPDYEFTVTNAGYDHSEVSNLNNINFPGGYPSGGNIWTGLYIEAVNVGLPEYFNAGSTTFSATNLIVDDSGFSGTLAGNEVFGIGDGTLGNWPVSMESINITLLQNSLNGGGMSGQIELPLAVEGIDYAATISYEGAGDSQLDYLFAISPMNGLHVPVWALAEIDIDEQSWLEVELVDNQFEPRAVLFGDVTFLFDDTILNDPENDVLSINFPDIGVEGLVVSPDGLSMYNGVSPFSHASPQKVMAGGFDVSLDSIALVGGDGLGLFMELSMDLTGSGDNANSFGAGAGLVFNGEWDGSSFGLHDVKLQSIKAHGDFSLFQISGELNIHRDDPVYGDGFDGNIDLKINAMGNGDGIGLGLDVMFGNMPTYKYWFVQGNATLGSASVPITGSVHLHGLMGGAYWHMTKNGDGEYVPDNSKSLGLLAGVTIGLPSEAKNVFHATTEMEILFNNSWGVSLFELRGSAYLMTAPIDLGGLEDFDFSAVSGEGYTGDGVNSQEGFPAVIELTCRASIMVPEKTVRIEAGFKAGIENILAANGAFESEFSPAGWFVKLGTPTTPISLQVGFLRKREGYFMLGTQIPGIPPVPQPVLDIIADNGGKIPKNVSNRIDPPEGNPEVANESQFGIVMGYYSGTGKDAGDAKEVNKSFFKAHLTYGLGFDLSLQAFENFQCGIEGARNRNWYAEGQMYAWLDAGVSIRWKLFRDEPRLIKLAELELAGLMTAGGPNPTYVEGNIAGKGVLFGRWEKSFSFDFKMGEQLEIMDCITPDDYDPLADLKLIADIDPRSGENNVSVFASPQVQFNLPVKFMQEVIALEAVEDGEEKTRYFTFKLKDFQIFKIQNGKKVPAWPQGEETHEITNKFNNVRYVYNSSRSIPQKSTIRVEVTADVYECANANCFSFIDENDNSTTSPIKSETDYTVFQSGELPEKIALSHLNYTLPGIYQRFYLQGDGNGVGYLEFKDQKYRDIITENPGEYFIRFVPLNGKYKKEGEYMGMDGKRVLFNHPLLDFNTIHYYQLVRRIEPLDPGIVHADGFGLTSEGRDEEVKPVFPTNGKNIGSFNEDLPKITQKQLLINQTLLSSKDVQVFGYFFKTSKYFQLKDKIAGMDIHKVESNYRIKYIKYKAEEPFDTYDQEHMIRIDWNPQYKFYSPPPHTWVFNYFEPRVDEASFMLKFYADPTAKHITPYTKILFTGVEKLNQDEVNAALGTVLEPLPTPGGGHGMAGGFKAVEGNSGGGGLEGIQVGGLVMADPIYKMVFMSEYYPYWDYQLDFMPKLLNVWLSGLSNNSTFMAVYNYALTHPWKDMYEATYQLQYRYKPDVLKYWNDNTSFYQYFSTKPHVTNNPTYSNE